MIKFKLFSNPIQQIKPWLNNIASKGYRLVSVNNCFYQFEKTDQKFCYDTQFLGANSSNENEKYIQMLEDSNYKTFRAPLNQANFAFGKVKIRMYAKNKGKIATSFGNYNKEILIVEFASKCPELLLTKNKDIYEQYKVIRNSHIQGTIVFLFLIGLLLYNVLDSGLDIWKGIGIAVLTVIMLYYMLLTIFENNNYLKYKKNSEIEE